jgi:hypothetical protein
VEIVEYVVHDTGVNSPAPCQVRVGASLPTGWPI